MEDSAWPAPASRPRASPLARRLAAERGLDLPKIEGSGPQGRIVARDLASEHAFGADVAGAPGGRPVPEAPGTARPAPSEDGKAEAQGSRRSERPSGEASRDGAAEESLMCEVVLLRQHVRLARLEVVREVIGESHNAVPLWAFAARALLRLGHGPLAVAEGLGAARGLEASSAEPVTALPGRIGAPCEAACVLVDLGPEAFDGGALPLPRGADVQIVLGAPREGRSGPEAEISLAARPERLQPADAAALLRALVAALESPGALLTSLPDV